MSTSTVVQEAFKSTEGYIKQHIEAAVQFKFNATDISESLLKREKKSVGKVRDIYFSSDVVVLVSTDRQSAFDRQICTVPFKGQVLNLTSQWWFKEAKEKIGVPNAVISVPDPNVTIARRCEPFPIEFVMRAYMTGSTSTSIWQNYNKGLRSYCGHQLPDGIKQNEKLPMGNLLTPTTKGETDELISAEEIIEKKYMNKEDWDVCAEYAHRLFKFGQEVASQRGLILVDTKYEFGRDQDGNIVLIDEVHTPDSSRYWIAESYEERVSQGKSPENVDKEILRQWYAKNCDPYKDEVLPEAPTDLVCELSRRYVMLYEMITGEKFVFPQPTDVKERVTKNVVDYFSQQK